MGETDPNGFPMSGANLLTPSRMTAAERLAEIGRILALAILRAGDRRLRQKLNDINEVRDVSLDFTAQQRGHDSTKWRRGESA